MAIQAATYPSRLLPGLLIAAGIAATAVVANGILVTGLGPFGLATYAPSAIILAVVLGIACHGPASDPRASAGLAFASKSLLKFAVALLGLRVAISDILDLGPALAISITLIMAVTLVVSVAISRLVGCSNGSGALIGAANSICGASAVLATCAVVPAYRNKDAEVVMAVLMANAVSTLAMVAYPALCIALGLSDRQTGILLGAAIQDVAQVVGAGYAISSETGDVALIVKMFRVLLLLPAVMAIGWWAFRSARLAPHAWSGESTRMGSPVTVAGCAPATPQVPAFAVAFLALCVVNSLAIATPVATPYYAPVRKVLIDASTVAMMVALGALGAQTSLAKLRDIEPRWIFVFLGSSATVLGLSIALVSLVIVP